MMLLLEPLFDQLIELLRSSDSLTKASLVARLDLDISAATVTQTKGGDFIVIDASRRAYPRFPGVIVSLKPPRTSVSLILEKDEDRIPFAPNLMADMNARVEHSKAGDGFASIANRRGAEVGCTVSMPDGRLQTVFCEIQRPGSV